MSAIGANSNLQGYYYGPNGEVRRGDTGRVVSDLADPSARPVSVPTGGSAKPLMLLSMGRISGPEDLDPVADILHSLVQEGKSAEISEVFSGMNDPKVFAICVRWAELYKEDMEEIRSVLDNVCRGEGSALGGLVECPKAPVEGMSEAFEIIYENFASPSSAFLANIDKYGIAGMFNELHTRELAKAYTAKDGRFIQGFMISRENGNAYKFFVGTPRMGNIADDSGYLYNENGQAYSYYETYDENGNLIEGVIYGKKSR